MNGMLTKIKAKDKSGTKALAKENFGQRQRLGLGMYHGLVVLGWGQSVAQGTQRKSCAQILVSSSGLP